MMHLGMALCLVPACAAFVGVLAASRYLLWRLLTRPHPTEEI